MHSWVQGTPIAIFLVAFSAASSNGMKLTASKLLLGVVWLLAVFSIGVSVSHAEVVYSQVGNGQSYHMSSAYVGANAGYVYFPGGYIATSSGAATDHGVPFTIPNSFDRIRVQRATGSDCSTLGHGSSPAILFAAGNEVSFNAFATSSDPAYCEATTFGGSVAASTTAIALFLGYSGASDYTLWGSPANAGGSDNGTFSSPVAGGVAFELCNTDCVGGGFTPPDWTGLNSTSTALTSLYQQNASDTLAQIATRCQGSGNVFSEALCGTFAFLFIPDPTVTNGYAQLAAVQIPAKFPFSWISEGKAIFDGIASPTSSTNFTTTVLDMHSLGIGSTTAIGNILPSVTAISSSTITQFLPAGMWSTIQTLLGAFAYLVLFWYIWHRVRTRFQHV